MDQITIDIGGDDDAVIDTEEVELQEDLVCKDKMNLD